MLHSPRPMLQIGNSKASHRQIQVMACLAEARHGGKPNPPVPCCPAQLYIISLWSQVGLSRSQTTSIRHSPPPPRRVLAALRPGAAAGVRGAQRAVAHAEPGGPGPPQLRRRGGPRGGPRPGPGDGRGAEGGPAAKRFSARQWLRTPCPLVANC